MSDNPVTAERDTGAGGDSPNTPQAVGTTGASAGPGAAKPWWRRRIVRWPARLLGLFAIGYAMWLAALWWLQGYAVFPGVMLPDEVAAVPPGGVEVWRMPMPPPGASDAGEPVDPEAPVLHAWYLPVSRHTPESPGPAVIFAHGNMETINAQVGNLMAYRELGVAVLMPEYRGYAGSPGRPSERAITADMLRWYRRLAERPEIDADRIVLHGRSLGSGVVCALAKALGEQDRAEGGSSQDGAGVTTEVMAGATAGANSGGHSGGPAAIVIESGFSSLRPFARNLWVPDFLLSNTFDNDRFLANWPGPVLIVHGTADVVVPIEHAYHNDEITPNSTFIIYEAMTHNQSVDRRFWGDVEAWLREQGVLR